MKEHKRPFLSCLFLILHSSTTRRIPLSVSSWVKLTKERPVISMTLSQGYQSFNWIHSYYSVVDHMMMMVRLGWESVRRTPCHQDDCHPMCSTVRMQQNKWMQCKRPTQQLSIHLQASDSARCANIKGPQNVVSVHLFFFFVSILFLFSCGGLNTAALFVCSFSFASSDLYCIHYTRRNLFSYLFNLMFQLFNYTSIQFRSLLLIAYWKW